MATDRSSWSELDIRRTAEEAIDEMEEMPVEGLLQAEAGVYGVIAATPDHAEGSWYLYVAVIPGLSDEEQDLFTRWAIDQFVALGTHEDPRGNGWHPHASGAWQKWAHGDQLATGTS
jgi:hypothetical protein